MPNDDAPDRAKVSSVFAFVSGVILLVFMYGAYRGAGPVVAWPVLVILAWGALFAAGLILWSFRGWLGHWIGNPTLSMVGGVSGTIITSVALVFALSSGLEQDKAVKEQTKLMQQQLEALQRIEQKLGGQVQPPPKQP